MNILVAATNIWGMDLHICWYIFFFQNLLAKAWKIIRLRYD